MFLRPGGAEIKVRYGNGWFLGEDRQHQTLDGVHPKELTVGLGSLVYARMQILVSRSREVTYDFYPTSRSRDDHAGHDASIAFAGGDGPAVLKAGRSGGYASQPIRSHPCSCERASPLTHHAGSPGRESA